MTLPKIEISSLPDLPELTGVFGSCRGASPQPAGSDGLVVLMSYLYEVLN